MIARAHGFGIDDLRRAVAALDNCREAFLQRFTATELLAIWRAWRECEWDYYPDRWHPEQVVRAIAGEVPRFDDNGKPIL